MSKIIEELRYILGELFVKYGNDKEIVRLSQFLDKFVYNEQKGWSKYDK